MEQVSQQLRGLEPAFNSSLDLDAVSQYILVMSQNAAAINAQIDQLVTMTDQLSALSAQLRGIEPAYQSTIDLEALGQYLEALAQTMALLEAQVDPLAALSSQQLELVSEQLRAFGPAVQSNVDLGALRQYLAALSQSAAAVNRR